MMKHEFENLAGYEVSVFDYEDIIEPMYMATKLNKEDFVKVVDKKRFALKPKKSYIKEMKALAKSLKETCDHYTNYDTKDKLNNLADEFTKRFYTSYNYYINTAETDFHRCSYPSNLVIHNSDYTLIDKIELA